MSTNKKMMSGFWIASIVSGTIFILNLSPAIAQERIPATQTFFYPIITALAAGVLTILQTVLMLSVATTRLKLAQGIGDGGNEDLARIARRHGNLTENAPIFLIALALLEIAGANHIVVTVLAVIFVLARFSHAIAFSMTSGSHPLRAFGATFTALSALATGGYLLWSLLYR